MKEQAPQPNTPAVDPNLLDTKQQFNPNLKNSELTPQVAPTNFDHMKDFTVASATPDLAVEASAEAKAKSDMAEFRSTQVGDELTRDPATGRFVSYDARRAEHAGLVPDPNNEGEFIPNRDPNHDEYKEMSASELARKLAEAEHLGDRTTEMNVSDALQDKIGTLEEAMLTNTNGKSVDSVTTSRIRGKDVKHDKTDALWDRVMSIKDKEAERLKNAEVYKFPNQEDIYYRPGEDKRTRLAIEVDEPGSLINFEKHENTSDPDDRMLLVTDTEDNEFLVINDGIYDISESRKQGDLVIEDLSEEPSSAKMPNLEIGKEWRLSDTKGITNAPVDSVEVATGFADRDTDLSARDRRSEDPFNRLLKELNDIEGAAEINNPLDKNPLDETQDPFAPPEGSRYSGVYAPRAEDGGRKTLRERFKSRKAKVAAGVAALAIAGGAGYAIAHDNDHEKAPTVTGISKTIDKDSLNKQLSPNTAHNTGHDGNTNNTVENEQSNEEVSLQAGENPWTVAEQRLRELGMTNPTNAQIEHYDKMMGGINEAYDYNGTSSENLPVGTKLKLPR